MEEKNIANVEISSEADFNIAFEDGKLKLSIVYAGKGVEAGAHVHVLPDYFMDKLAAAIPGNIDDSIIAMIKVAMKAM